MAPAEQEPLVDWKLWLWRVGCSVRARLPRPVAVWIAERLGDACWLLLHGYRHAVASNLTRLAASRTPSERRRLCRATFRNFAVCVSDFLWVPHGTVPSALALLHYDGLEHLDAALARGRGVVLLSPHLGNPEMAGFLLASHGYRVHCLVENVRPALLEQLSRYRSTGGVNVIPLDRAGEARSVIKRGEVLAMIADRVIGRTQGTVVNFTGGRRSLPLGPAVLALASGAPLLVASIVLDPTDRRRGYVGVIDPPIPTTDLGEEPVTQLTARIADRFARHVARCPDQWFVFQPDWLDDASTEPNRSLAEQTS